ncbi:MAG TPA: macrolide ABC transporter ATP-binding protein [Microscillaceae bacterium]|nr:macrolide ABC transporter ATP-binding protein [Microscillaceae bacterium]
MDQTTGHRIVASLRGATKRYMSGDTEIVALHPTDVEIHNKELTLILGPSGSGKTTLLSLLGCVIYPTAGEVWIGDTSISKLSPKKLAQVRLHNIGFVFQSMNLIAPLTACENVMMPLQLMGLSSREARKRALSALEMVGMLDRQRFKPKQMSGGQQQRVAIARALVTNPPMMLCDEPTAALDAQSLVVVMNELRNLSDQGKAVAVVTHDPRLKPYADRIITVENGQVSQIEENLERPKTIQIDDKH